MDKFFQVKKPDIFDWEEAKRKRQGFWGDSQKKDSNKCGPQFGVNQHFHPEINVSEKKMRFSQFIADCF